MGIVKWSETRIKEYIETERNYKLIKLIEYKGVNSRVTLWCKNKNHKPYTVGFNGFKNGSGCKECQYELLRNKFSEKEEDVIKYLNGFGYELLSKYINMNEHITVKCPEGHITNTMTFGNFKHKNTRCDLCYNSHGENKIIEILNKYNINYEYQKEYPDLLGLGHGHLSYDFYLNDYNILIEYQGEQHITYKSGFHKTYETFERQKEHDRRKREYAKNHNIYLLEIWWNQFDDIEKIIKNVCNL